MKSIKHVFIYVVFSTTFLFVTVLVSFGQQEGISVHDPCIIKQDSTYHIFCTGWGITSWSSTDLKHWTKGKSVFDKVPAWTQHAVLGFRNFFWAPDISYYNGQYYLFYAVSAFGKNTSCIGLAANKTLNESSPDYHWSDHGKIIQSVPGRDMWNAIDPNLIVDGDGTPWLDFGSFWDGIKLVKLNPDRLKIAEPEVWYTIATRKRTFGISDTLAGDAAIEAPYIFHKGKYYYLFVSFDYCCRGVNSNYKIVIGRSEGVNGPYMDKGGTPLTKGGGTILLEGDRNWDGLGHNAILSDAGKDYLVFHAYDANDNGKPKLRILQMDWDKNGWPTVVNENK